MTEVSNEGRVRIAIRVLRFIVVAMLIGLAVEPVLLSVITRGHEGEADAGFTYTLLGVLVALGLAELVAYPFVRKVMMDRLRADFQPAEPGVGSDRARAPRPCPSPAGPRSSGPGS